MQGITYEYGNGRLEDKSQNQMDIQNNKPTHVFHVFNAVGVTGRPNVDWCESHKPETIRNGHILKRMLSSIRVTTTGIA